MEYLFFDDPINWDYLMSLNPKQRTRIMPQTIEEMHQYSIDKARYSNKQNNIKGVGYWHFRRFIQLNEKYEEALNSEIQEEIDYFYRLFMAYKDRQENNYAKYSPSSHGYKHPFRNTYERKYSNKDKKEAEQND